MVPDFETRLAVATSQANAPVLSSQDYIAILPVDIGSSCYLQFLLDGYGLLHYDNVSTKELTNYVPLF